MNLMFDNELCFFATPGVGIIIRPIPLCARDKVRHWTRKFRFSTQVYSQTDMSKIISENPSGN